MRDVDSGLAESAAASTGGITDDGTVAGPLDEEDCCK